MNRIENDNVRKLNKNMTAYIDAETGDETIKMSFTLRDKDKRNGDLMEYLLDFGLAGKLNEQILDLLDKNTEGYRKFKRTECDGRWTEDCKEFVPEKLEYCIVTLDDEDKTKLCYLTYDRTEAIKEAGKIYMSLNELDKRRLKVEIRVYDGEKGNSRFDVIQWLK